MRRLAVGAAAVALVVGPLAAAPAVADPAPSCWGQATQVFAQMGLMGDHSSSYPTPRLGLRNLARAALGPDATMADLGVFVSNDLGLSIDACLG